MATVDEKIALLEKQQALTVALAARILRGNWHEGPESAEALLRAIAPADYGQFEAAVFPKGQVEPAPAPPQEPPPASTVKWIGSPYFTPGHTAAPEVIFLHTMAGSLAGSDSWFNSSQNPGSASHYGVGLNGEIHQYVRLEDSAWTNGRLETGERYTARFGSGWPNGKCLTIETEDKGNANEPVTDALYAGVLACCRLIVARYPTVKVLSGHHIVSPQSRANCPGKRWTSGRIQALAKETGLELYI